MTGPYGLFSLAQGALDAKCNAIDYLKVVKTFTPEKIASSPEWGAVWAGMQVDIAALVESEVYAFNSETQEAIRIGAETIPHDAPLSSVEIPPVLAGWFWFETPLPVVTAASASETTAALLWMWEPHETTPTLRFSAYVADVKNRAGVRSGTVLPSTQWRWPIHMSLHQMLAFNVRAYREAYGPGGRFAGHDDVMGEDATLKAIADLSVFFLMACVWFTQQVLVEERGHIERHARKRYQRDYQIAPTVRVILLRKARPGLDPEGESDRTLSVRFVVRGHARLQPCGTDRADRKLIWINPYTKGPDDAPFKPAMPTVNVVVR